MRNPQTITYVKSLSPFIALVLTVQLLFIPGVSAAALGDGIRNSGAAVAGTWGSFLIWLTSPSPQVPEARGLKPPLPEHRSDKLRRLARLQIDPKDAVQLQERQSMIFTAVPFDSEGSAIHGLQAEWESSNKQIVFVKKTGEAVAGKPGTATLTARAGLVTASVQVIVNKGDGEPFGKKKPDSTRDPLRVRQYPADAGNDIGSRIASRGRRRHHSPNQRTVSAAAPFMFLRDPNDDPLPDNETVSLFKPVNTVGSPPGKRRGGAWIPSPATRGTETNGNRRPSSNLHQAGALE